MRYLLPMVFAAIILLGVGLRDGGEARTIVDRFDHYSTGFPLEGKHENLGCESCHAPPEFKGAPRTCAQCHNNFNAEGMGLRHIPVNRSCESCHTVQDWRTARYDHIDLGTSCTVCHNNFLAPGKTANHPLTSNICSDCHNTVHWNQTLPTAPAS